MTPQMAQLWAARGGSTGTQAQANCLPSPASQVTYSLECVAKQLGGSRLVVWYSPSRREGMMEIRLLNR